MKRTIGVFLGNANRRVGTLRFDSQGARQSAAFEYDREWLAASDRFALEPDLPLVTGAQFHKPPSREASIFHGAIADTEPDGWARRVILRDHAKRRALTRAAGEAQDHQPLTPIDYLLAVDDFNHVGALRFQDEEGVFQRAIGEGQRTAPPLIELSTDDDC
jgi:serine/threonine-protein kinase HipA